MIGMRRRPPRLLLSIIASAVIAMALAQSSWAISGKQPIVVVLCKFTDQTDEPQDVQYFQDLFSETGTGENNLFDFWKDVSYGNLDLTGTVVKGWYTAQMTVGEFNAIPQTPAGRAQQIDVCTKEAIHDADFSKFAGVYVVVNNKNLSGPLFGSPGPTKINGTTYSSLGQAMTEWDQTYSGIQHESLHLFKMNHSRAISNNPLSQPDYSDSYDVGSCFSCIGTPDKNFRNQGSNTVGIPGRVAPEGGPGLNAVQLLTADSGAPPERIGWLATNRVLTLPSSSCAQQTIQLAALNHPEATGYLAIRAPAAVPIFQTSATLKTTGDYYTVELRDKSGWDAGIFENGILVHLHGQDSYSYWVDQSGAWGNYTTFNPLMIAGDEYVDAAKQNFWLAVNSIDTAGHTAVVTIGTRDPNGSGDCKIDPQVSYSGATTGDFNDLVTLAADLTVNGTTAPVPDAIVSFTLGTQSCAATTDDHGHAACSFTIKQHPGSYNVNLSFAGDAAYDAVNASAGFTITREESKVTYDG